MVQFFKPKPSSTPSIQAGDDIILEQIEAVHADSLFALVEENRLYLREWLPWVDSHASLVDTLDFIYRAREQRAANNGLTLGILHRGKLRGIIGHNSIDWGNRNCQLGYWLDARLQGQGVMTRACAALVSHSFTELGLQRVEIRCASGNIKSRTIPERLGFVQEGVLRQAGMWIWWSMGRSLMNGRAAI